DFDFKHERIRPLTNLFVKRNPRLFMHSALRREARGISSSCTTLLSYLRPYSSSTARKRRCSESSLRTLEGDKDEGDVVLLPRLRAFTCPVGDLREKCVGKLVGVQIVIIFKEPLDAIGSIKLLSGISSFENAVRAE